MLLTLAEADLVLANMTTLINSRESLSALKAPDISKIMGVSDTHPEQLCGVQKSLHYMLPVLKRRGLDFELIQTNTKNKTSLPIGKSGAWLTWNPRDIIQVIHQFEKLQPDAVHIFTEGTLGLAMKCYLKSNGLKHSSSFHTNWPEYGVTFSQRYVRLNQQPALDLLWKYFEDFHASSEVVMTRSKTTRELLESRGIKNVVIWNGGVDLSTFSAEGYIDSRMLEIRKKSPHKPILICPGRISDEKNIKAFLDAKVDAIKVVVGDITPYAKMLQSDYSSERNIIFLGKVDHNLMPSVMRGADLLVFPSKTDTFGLVNIEGLACGIPVVGFADTCVRDIIEHEKTGILSEKSYDLSDDIVAGLELASLDQTSANCVNRAQDFSIDNVAKQFTNNLVKI